ncbi:hypothetical protein FKG94_13435 [Exilibacterium tricleocarpae]|uniref:AsmA family protein n=1 Tax=Exilibacterium tricleocarpae TaxID=2591008 RepID=A0A545TLK6_9GAMM|nr:hypothetical protein [Exilibacterium tricleocarpae]TQV78078.1 hypothetical protein FKG94_13435 [Exilibacterium tricleocarpae]
MKLGKILIGLVVAVVAVLVLVVVIGLQNINELVKAAIESVGSDVTRTAVTLERADIQLTEGRGALHELVVANPAGYGSDYAVRLGEVVLQVEPTSVTGPVVVINEVRIAGAQLIAEQRELTRTNLTDLLDNMKPASTAGAGGEPAADSGGAAAAEVRLAVEKISFADNSLRLISEKWGERTLDMPAIELTDIGDPQTGLSPEELTQALLTPLMERAKQAATSAIREQLKDEAEDKLKQQLEEKLDDKQKEKLDKLKGLLGR